MKVLSMPVSSESPRVLIIEDDQDTQEVLGAILSEEGYQVSLVASPQEALKLLDEQVFHFILTDLFTRQVDDPLGSVAALRAQAQPTPIGVMTGWNVSAEAVQRAGFACLVKKPFGLEEMLAAVAACLRAALSPEQQRQAEVMRRFFAVLNARNWDAALRLCVAQLRYYPAPDSSYLPARKLEGKDAYQAYVKEVFERFAVTRFENLLIYARPKGLAARYTYGLTLPDGQPQQRAGATLFRFRGELIAQIGVKIRRVRTRKLLEHQREVLQSAPRR
jgi:CheY-like chemotaxis protein